MAFLPQVYSVGFSSANTTASMTPAITLNGIYLYVYLAVPTMTTGYGAASTPIYVQGSYDGTTYYRFTNSEPTNNTLVAGINDFTIASSVSQRMVLIPNFSFPYMKVEISGVVTNPTQQTGTFKVVCVSNQ